MLLTIDATRVRDLVVDPRLIREDRILPADFPDNPNSTYQPGYDWLFTYERQIAAFLEPWLKPFRYDLIGERGLLCEALSNAFLHGNRKDPTKVIFLRVRLGTAGIMVEIEDCGCGFPASQVYASYRDKRRYFLSAGNGMRLMADSPDFGVFHSTTGTIVYLFRLFSGDMRMLIPFGVLQR